MLLEEYDSRVPVAHACNLSYSGGRDQKISSKPAQANSLQDPILKITNTKRAGGVAQVVKNLPSKCVKSQVQNFSTTKKKKKKEDDDGKPAT
jgi:hypothetical protein